MCKVFDSILGIKRMEGLINPSYPPWAPPDPEKATRSHSPLFLESLIGLDLSLLLPVIVSVWDSGNGPLPSPRMIAPLVQPQPTWRLGRRKNHAPWRCPVGGRLSPRLAVSSGHVRSDSRRHRTTPETRLGRSSAVAPRTALWCVRRCGCFVCPCSYGRVRSVRGKFAGSRILIAANGRTDACTTWLGLASERRPRRRPRTGRTAKGTHGGE